MEETELSAILARVGRIASRAKAEKPVTKDDLSAAATMVARRGYRLSRVTLCALDAILKGYNVLLSGNVGTGKTAFFKAVNPDVKILDMNEVNLWKYEDLVYWLNECACDDVLVDDIGAGAACARNYGVAFDALMVILQRRAHSRAHTHFTTNLDNDGLIKALDYRTVDRIYGLARPFVMDVTESRRTAAPIYS